MRDLGNEVAASKPLNVRLKAEKKFLSQSVEYSTHCINYAKREQEKPLLLKLTTLTSRSHYHELRSLLSRAMSHVWPVNT